MYLFDNSNMEEIREGYTEALNDQEPDFYTLEEDNLQGQSLNEDLADELAQD